MTDILLFNGFTPLRRSPADVFLDNGIGMLRAALQEANIDFMIEDCTSLNEIRKFDVPEVSIPLRALFQKQLFGNGPLSQPDKILLQTHYDSLLAFHQKKMHEYLEMVSDVVAQKQIPILGIKLWAGSTFNYCVHLCHLVHQKSPETIVVVGGPQVNCYSFEGQILSLTPFDVAVYSEGEAALVEIVQTCKNSTSKTERLSAIQKANIPNTIFRRNGNVIVSPVQNGNVNHKKIPKYGDMEGKVPIHTVVDALGCDYGKCTFCIHPKIYPKFRKRTPALVVDEMVEMVKQGIGLFSFTASDTPLSHGVKISEEILKRKLHIEFTMLTRAIRNAQNSTEKIISQFRILIRAGLKSVFFGVESGNDSVLKHVMNKGVCADDIAVTMECLRTAAQKENTWVNIIASFIYPVPLPNALLEQGITQDTVMEDNLTLLKRIMPDSFHAIPGLLYPGTKWYTHNEDFNIMFEKSSFSAKWISQEFSYHGYVALGEESLYSFDNLPFNDMIPASMEFTRKGNALGIPSDLWEEQFIFARACNVTGTQNLQKLSEDLFLDLLCCNDSNTRHMYDAAINHSTKLAQKNTHLFRD